MQLFVNTYGTSLRMVDGLLSIKKKDTIERLPIGKIEKIFLTKSIALSTDVLYACLENAVDVIVTERNGQPIGRLWNHRFGSISSLRRKQLGFSTSAYATEWVINQIHKKTSHHIELLYCLLSTHDPHPRLIHDTVEKIKKIILKLDEISSQDLAEAAPRIRALEGQMAKLYFRAVSKHMPHRFIFHKRSKRPALDIVNAMLNYAYGILYSHVESSLIKAGLDPYIGIFHRDDYNKPVLTYDVIEVFRPWADWPVFHLCLNEVMEDTMFLTEEGTYWMQSESKRILIQHFTDFFEEVVDFEGSRFSRFTHIDRLCSKLASDINKKM